MDLFLVQHGEAKSASEDPERPLTDGGAAAVARLADWAAAAGVAVDQIRHSGKRRAEQTAGIVAERLTPTGGVVVMKGLAPRDDVRPAALTIAAEDRALMLVGHQPFLGRLAAQLVAGDAAVPLVVVRNAGLVCVTRERGAWTVGWSITPELIASQSSR